VSKVSDRCDQHRITITARGASKERPLQEATSQSSISQLPQAMLPVTHLHRAAGESTRLSPPGAVTGLSQGSPKIELRRQNRLNGSLVCSETFVQVQAGVLALEAVPAGGRRQILDFLMPGDGIPASLSVTFPGFFLRALTNVSLELRLYVASNATAEGWLETSDVVRKLRLHLMRRTLHQIIIGQLDSESRVSSFLLMLALRYRQCLGTNLLLPLPMSRDDIADYLVMNPDTLSRIMMRFETLRIIRRLNRHSLNLIDDQKLAQLSPIRALLLGTLGASSRPNNPHNSYYLVASGARAS
jgi:Crp-like helix-turn-helix domain